MHRARFLSARLAREDFDEWRLAIHKKGEDGVDRAEVIELIETVSARPELAGSLRAAKEEDT